MLFDTFLHYAGEIITFFVQLVGDNPWLTILGALAFVFSFLAWQTNKTQRLNWTDILTEDGPSNRVSLTKMLQLVGSVVATWLIVYITVHNKMSVDYLMVYLAYVGAIEGWRNFVATRWGGLSGGNNQGGFGGYGGYNNGYRPPTPNAPPAAPVPGSTDADLDAAMEQVTGSKAAPKTPNSQ